MLTFVIFAAALACANAGLLGAPAVATYSAAPAVSSAYISQAAPVAVAHAAPLAVAHAAPLAVAHAAPVAVHAPAIGASHQSVVRSLGGNQAVSHYTKAVDSAFSSVRKFDTRITNDALTVAHAAPVVSAYAAHAPVVSTYAAHAPVVSTYAAHAPVVSSYAAPLVAKTAAVAYSPAAVVSHTSFSGFGAHYAW
ncbi:Cuticle 3 domain containing protein [Asbolus verrucosus]|uniref:Cuticle 3 domain containing protein n=1 Tax=Asbolus verrucosus TaxID=1661398 RepID=A0A482W586_ASBVE|nr:Cuticle 3 domain containing protein [Asbolus verrucosus]